MKILPSVIRVDSRLFLPTTLLPTTLLGREMPTKYSPYGFRGSELNHWRVAGGFWCAETSSVRSPHAVRCLLRGIHPYQTLRFHRPGRVWSSAVAGQTIAAGRLRGTLRFRHFLGRWDALVLRRRKRCADAVIGATCVEMRCRVPARDWYRG